LPAISAEVEAAQKVKDQPILIITGNPPYSAKSKNNGAWASNSIKPYEFVDGDNLKERKHWLNDDYVKFLRFAQLKIEQTGEGIVGVITNRWWIENITFRGMRQSLLSTFDQIYILDLNGEVGNVNDENVFDIRKGVAIAIFVKRKNTLRKLRYYSIRGTRLDKYKMLSLTDVSNTDWEYLNPTSPNYFLLPRTEIGRETYKRCLSVEKIFIERSTGILTGRDKLAIAQTQGELRGQISSLAGETSSEELERRLGLKKVTHWSLEDARRKLKLKGIHSDLVRRIAYRPFDTRFYYDDEIVVFWRRQQIMRNMTEGRLGLSVCRLIKDSDWRHTIVVNEAADDSLVSDKSKERAYLFPLYLSVAAPDTTAKIESAEASSLDWTENLSAPFRDFLDARYHHHYTPEEILGYIYAVLHAPSYRSRYAEFLRIDFPRIPFPEARPEFDALSALGATLVDAHLLRQLPRGGLATLQNRGNREVEAVRPRRTGSLYQQDAIIRARAAGGVGFSHRRLSSARQVSQIAQGPHSLTR
jgi:predicted helicase